MQKQVKILLDRPYLQDRRLARHLAWASSARYRGQNPGPWRCHPRTTQKSLAYDSVRFWPSTLYIALWTPVRFSRLLTAAALYWVWKNSQRNVCETRNTHLTRGSLSVLCPSRQSAAWPAATLSKPNRTHTPSPWASCNQNMLFCLHRPFTTFNRLLHYCMNAMQIIKLVHINIVIFTFNKQN